MFDSYRDDHDIPTSASYFPCVTFAFGANVVSRLHMVWIVNGHHVGGASRKSIAVCACAMTRRGTPEISYARSRLMQGHASKRLICLAVEPAHHTGDHSTTTSSAGQARGREREENCMALSFQFPEPGIMGRFIIFELSRAQKNGCFVAFYALHKPEFFGECINSSHRSLPCGMRQKSRALLLQQTIETGGYRYICTPQFCCNFIRWSVTKQTTCIISNSSCDYLYRLIISFSFLAVDIWQLQWLSVLQGFLA